MKSPQLQDIKRDLILNLRKYLAPGSEAGIVLLALLNSDEFNISKGLTAEEISKVQTSLATISIVALEPKYSVKQNKSNLNEGSSTKSGAVTRDISF